MKSREHGRLWCLYVAALLVCLVAAACSAGKGKSLGDDGDDAGATSAAGTGGSTGVGFDPTTSGAGAGILQVEPPCDFSDPNDDGDGDGWTDAEGDCNDCTPQMNPGALDYPGNDIDDDCNGTADDDPTACDDALAIDSADPLDGARAMDLCKMAQGKSYGVVSAEYITVDGATKNPDPLGHGILTGFGPLVTPQEGAKMFAVSSGTARQPSDPGYQNPQGYDKMYTSGAAPGFPKESPACPGVITGQAHDSIALRLRIRTPTNAKSFSFNVNMYTWEYPVFICTTYNDFVTAILTPTPPGQSDGNISFDTQGNPLSVNNAFLQVCACPNAAPPPCNVGGKTFDCSLGASELNGTGFEEHAATGWLVTTSPIQTPGEEITIEFGAWDSGDGILDTTGLFDNFKWSVEDTPTATTPVPK
jgi:hypothetical protein